MLPSPPPHRGTTASPPPPAWGWYVAWALVGAGAALSLLGIMTIGLFIAPFVGLAGLALVTQPRARLAAPAAICGLALPVLFVAWLNRDGPGNICTTTASSQDCVEEWSPWPFLVFALAVVFLGVGVSLAVRRSVARARARNEAASAYRIGTEMPPRR